MMLVPLGASYITWYSHFARWAEALGLMVSDLYKPTSAFMAHSTSGQGQCVLSAFTSVRIRYGLLHRSKG